MDLAFDRVPPHSFEAERSVLGAILLNPEDTLTQTADVFKGNDEDDLFYSESHAWIYKAILSLCDKNIPIDPTTIMEELIKTDKLNEIGGLTYLGDLLNAVPTSANVEYYAQIVLDNALLRKLIMTCTFLAGDAYKESDAKSLLDRAEVEITSIAKSVIQGGDTPIADSVDDALAYIRLIAETEHGITGVVSGISELDMLIGGFKNGEITIIGARPSVGKTALALNIAYAASTSGIDALIFSLEMSKMQLTTRMFGIACGVDHSRISGGFLVSGELEKAERGCDTIRQLPIHIEDNARQDIFSIRSSARKFALHRKCGIIIIDYLQLIRSTGKKYNTRNEEVAEIMHELKALSRELDMPVVSLCQLNRTFDHAASNTDKLKCFRESGDVEQDTDVAILIEQPSPDQIKALRDSGTADAEMRLNLCVAKNRNGPTGDVKVIFNKPIQQLYSLGDEPLRGGSDETYEDDGYDDGDEW